MRRKINIFFTVITALAAGLGLQSCTEDVIEEKIPDREELIEQGQYITARRAAEEVTSYGERASEAWFEVGTPYRLLAFVKPYKKADAQKETPVAQTPRFNRVVKEGETANGLHFIDVGEEPDRWLGFMALPSNEPLDGEDQLVSLDFYGFTYGKPVTFSSDTDRSGYLPLDGINGETKPGANSLKDLKRTESVSTADGGMMLNDLLYGRCLNRNIVTTSGEASASPQSVIPFIHCFSKLQFMVVQQADENNNEVPLFEDLQIEKVEITGTYGTGSVYLEDGKVELSGNKINRTLRFAEGFNGPVGLQQADMGEMVLFPSAGADLRNADLAAGYDIGLDITVTCKNEQDLINFLKNTNSPPVVTGVPENNPEYYRGTIRKLQILDNYTNKPLKLEQGTIYRLIISFQKDKVRIITLRPQVEEWLPGEGTVKDPWQDQPMGQPQMFDNIIWSDRNLGADHYDPTGDRFEATVGYFYQSGRNIPYYPFSKGEKGQDGVPTYLNNKNGQQLGNKDTSWGSSPYRFYPIADKRILNMLSKDDWCIDKNSAPQMEIPETKPENAYFNFLKGTDSDTKNGLQPGSDMHWELGQQNQPTSGSWELPSVKQFMSIFPSTPFAGNITMRDGGKNYSPMDWNHSGDYPIKGTETVRVTVPFYEPGMAEPTGRSEDYRNAWRKLRDNPKDPGTTQLDKYSTRNDGYGGSPKWSNNTDYEPDGDPENGYASVYVISKKDDGSLVKLKKDNENIHIKSWGTIYGIKRVYTSEAYRMRWRALVAFEGDRNPGIYIEICRYRCESDDVLTEENYMTEYDWDHPAARIIFPVSGLGDWTGKYINFGTECQYATSDPINGDGKTSAVQIKITGDNEANAYIAIVKDNINRNFGKQIRPIMSGSGARR